MAFQMGFNWMGNKNTCLFTNGTKAELIDYVKAGCQDAWDILAIGIAVNDPQGHIVYQDLNGENIHRNDALGEFLNRPLFIMKSKKM